MAEYDKIAAGLPQHWRIAPLGELVEDKGISYGIVQPGNHSAQGVPIVRVKDLKNGQIDPTDPMRVAPEIEVAYARTRLSGGEVLLSLVGSVGESAVVPESLAGWNVARAIAVLRTNKSVPACWLNICLSSELVQHYIRMFLNTTVQATLNLKDVRRLPIIIPPLREMEAIAAVLGALDDKIVVNDRIATTADTLRSALLEDAQQQRPDDFVAQPLSQVADFINGRAFTKDATGNGRMVIRIAEINSGPGPSTVYNDIEVDEKHLARPGDVLFSWSGSLGVARWFRPEAIVNQHIFKVIPRNDHPEWLAFEAVKSKLADYRAIAADKATTMGHIQRRHLDEKVIVPISEAIDRLDRQAGSLWRRALVAEQESLTLAALRDSVLPELMSGRLRVKEAEKAVEEAV
ncbi:restriction endonuclease subunit S [Micromonospora sp. URMC 106]|uniref:restriction endonuclease subunit S n=1 Tax=Micromonospora sp. URMC 106 TaxID=3423408 RepID=UPI003F1D7D08